MLKPIKHHLIIARCTMQTNLCAIAIAMTKFSDDLQQWNQPSYKRTHIVTLYADCTPSLIQRCRCCIECDGDDKDQDNDSIGVLWCSRLSTRYYFYLIIKFTENKLRFGFFLFVCFSSQVRTAHSLSFIVNFKLICFGFRIFCTWYYRSKWSLINYTAWQDRCGDFHKPTMRFTEMWNGS